MRIWPVLVLAAWLAGAGQNAGAAPWTRGYVVGSYEVAFHYGGRTGFTRSGEVEPGSDCPHGSTVHFANPDHVRQALNRQAWRDPRDIDLIVAPPGLDQVPGPATTRFSIWGRAVSYRGWKKGIETYVNPFAAEDTGQPEVMGKISEGLDLDNNPNTGFTGPDGQKGVDNNLYRAWGCDAPWRGNGNATLDLRANDKMLDGLFTIVIRVTGNQDPTNDDNAVIEIGYSPDRIIKDARGGLAADYSYRLLKSEQYTKLKARIRNGVVDSEQVSALHMPRMAWIYDQTGDAFFRQGRLRLTLKPDGTMSGIVAGYRDWRDVYNQNTFAQSGGEQGVREHEDAIALYYALKRNADGMKDPATGRYLGISTAYRITGIKAFVVEPDPARPIGVNILTAEEARKRAFEATSAAVIRSTTTRIVQDVPPGTTEAAAPRLEYIIKGLPNTEYLLRMLDRPHYAYKVDMVGNVLTGVPAEPEPTSPPPPRPEVPQRQPGREALTH
ncbi:MAG TPA: hypothetical protein VH189_03045 [Rhizomicrobium sp.]|nr:hypothetical protein [Rhizomicrobium sp.]